MFNLTPFLGTSWTFLGYVTPKLEVKPDSSNMPGRPLPAQEAYMPLNPDSAVSGMEIFSIASG